MKKIIVPMMMLMSLNVFSGNEKGNGGYSVVCRDSKKNIISAELLDVFEGRVLRYFEYSNNPDLKEADFKVFGVSKIAELNKSLADLIEKEMNRLEAMMVFVDEGLVLEPTNDAFPVVGRKDCQFEQLANYLDSNKLLVSKEIYGSLSPLNTASLKLHEVIYSLARKSGEVNSTNARILTSWSLAVGAKADEKITEIVTKLAKQVAPSEKVSCGLSGSLEERISDCNYTLKTKAGHKWKLINHTVKQWHADIVRSVYLSPTNRIVFQSGFDINAEAGSIYGKRNAKRIERSLRAGTLCTSDALVLPPADLISQLSLQPKVASKAEVEELFKTYGAHEVFKPANTVFIANEESLEEKKCDFKDFFTIYENLNDQLKNKTSCDLSVFNSRNNKNVVQKLKVRDVQVVCIE